MYRLLDLNRCQNDIQITPEQPLAVLDTSDFAISAIAVDGNLIYCNRAFLREFHVDHQYACKYSIRESLPDVWKRFKQPTKSSDDSFKVINLRADGYDKPLGHLLVHTRNADFRDATKDLHGLISVDNHPEFNNSYAGLYVADTRANTIKVNPSYEKIAFLSKNDLVGRNLEELVERGFFSKSITLSILEGLKHRSVIQQSLLQTLLCGKDVFVTGKPVFSGQNTLAYVLTYVHDLVVLNTIARKCLEREQRLQISGANFKEMPTHRGDTGQMTGDTDPPQFLELPIVMRDPRSIATGKQLVRAAAYRAPILLTGETGVGKDLMAKYIHLTGAGERDFPFVSVNCSAIPGELLESELFGYEEGAFSGASRKGRTGLFAAADGGILFLNEISEIPLALQTKLLSALDEGCIRPLGSSKTRKVRTRIICATNRDLQDCIERGTFRSDLYYRIKVLTIKIAPLRDRSKDILPLVHHFMARLADEYALTRYLSPEVQEILLGYHWPGNVRELRNVVEQMMIYSSTNQVSLGDLPEELLGSGPRKAEQTHRPLTEGVSLKTAVQSYEKKLIEQALAIYPSTAIAARALGINPTTLARKLKRSN